MIQRSDMDYCFCRRWGRVAYAIRPYCFTLPLKDLQSLFRELEPSFSSPYLEILLDTHLQSFGSTCAGYQGWSDYRKICRWICKVYQNHTAGEK
ncbi:hypothetical protein [Sphingobacterium chuzhouense]|uniref:Uncharacterized protein n=1 Tax=Sphingobacterium chuzhouense TaxID=1742264 RepID=A0ABR7XPX4_9SPHI|nr:hypothetical protein [Sphingobacterium chuzhouense]MBD1421208.1 hypothetical protein [Sphingobacterium chuzhouense]